MNPKSTSHRSKFKLSRHWFDEDGNLRWSIPKSDDEYLRWFIDQEHEYFSSLEAFQVKDAIEDESTAAPLRNTSAHPLPEPPSFIGFPRYEKIELGLVFLGGDLSWNRKLPGSMRKALENIEAYGLKVLEVRGIELESDHPIPRLFLQKYEGNKLPYEVWAAIGLLIYCGKAREAYDKAFLDDLMYYSGRLALLLEQIRHRVGSSNKPGRGPEYLRGTWLPGLYESEGGDKWKDWKPLKDSFLREPGVRRFDGEIEYAFEENGKSDFNMITEKTLDNVCREVFKQLKKS